MSEYRRPSLNWVVTGWGKPSERKIAETIEMLEQQTWFQIYRNQPMYQQNIGINQAFRSFLGRQRVEVLLTNKEKRQTFEKDLMFFLNELHRKQREWELLEKQALSLT